MPALRARPATPGRQVELRKTSLNCWPAAPMGATASRFRSLPLRVEMVTRETLATNLVSSSAIIEPGIKCWAREPWLEVDYALLAPAGRHAFPPYHARG